LPEVEDPHADEDLRAEVGRISVVARYVPPEPAEAEYSFDEDVSTALRKREEFMREALGDALGPDYAITRLTVDITRSVEIVAVIAVAYKLLKNFNEVVETVTRARGIFADLVNNLIRFDAVARYEYVVAGRLAVVPADTFVASSAQVVPPGYLPVAPQAPPALAQPGGLAPLVGRVAAPRQPIDWDLNAFLSRLLVPLAFLLGVAGLIVGLIAGFRLI
jgi:hypothetical protein